MTTLEPLSEVLLNRWRKIRAMSYDYLDALDESHLSLKLPFPESRPIGYQFWCMTGAQESYIRALEHGEWQGFSCSLNGLDRDTPDVIAAHMHRADEALTRVLSLNDGLMKDGQPKYETVFLLLEHEMHHQGQLINLMYCHHLPIPKSWQDKWALAYDDV